MSIQSFRDGLQGIPGYERLTMSYENGGKTQVFAIDKKVVRLGPNATAAEVREAFEKLK